ncbi:MAG: type IV pilus secretin PilQ [Smithella sp.]
MKYSKNIIMTGLSFLVLMFFFGCADEFKSEKKDPFFEKWSTLAETSEGHSPKAKEINESAILAKKQVSSSPLGETAVRKLPNGPINLTMRQADLKSVLRAMAKSVGLNLLVKNELQGSISVDFKAVPWDKAFTGLLRTYNLSYVWEGNIVRVMTIDDVAQDLKQKVQLRDIQWVEPLLEPVVIGIDYTDPAKLADTLQGFITKDKDGKPRGSIKVDEHSNSLVISALHDDLKKMLPIIEKLDKPTPQILIKANIVETTKIVARDLGIMWGGSASTTLHGSESLSVSGGGTRASSTSPITPTANGAIGIGGEGLGINFPASNLTSTAASSLGLTFGTIGGNLLEVQLQALQTASLLNVLSSPSITTLDNQKAFTENGERVPYVTVQQTAGTTGAIPTYTTNFVDVLMRLEITPHVIDGKNLKMTIFVQKDDIDTTREDILGDPYIIKKQTQTVLIVKDGETIVISGLTKRTKSDSGNGVPWLEDIPVLGWAFKSDSKSDEKDEVLIFITPHILQAGNNQTSHETGKNNIENNLTEKN